MERQLVGAHVPACTHKRGLAIPALRQKITGFETTELQTQRQGCGQDRAERVVPVLENLTLFVTDSLWAAFSDVG